MPTKLVSGTRTDMGIMATCTPAATNRPGVTILQRKPAGPCSKEKKKKRGPNKAPVIAHECPSVMRAHVLEVPAGRDVLSCVAQFARRVRRGALVLGAAGRVADVVLRDPAALVLRGTMEILSMSGCFFPSAAGTAAVFLAGPRGAVLGGGVCRVVAAGPVVVMVATFVAAAMDRLPLESHPLPQPLPQQMCRRKLSAKT